MKNNRSTTLGVLLIILGVIAVMLPLFATLLLLRLIAWLLIFAAIDQVVHAFRSKIDGGLFIRVLLAVLYAVAGGLILGRPMRGAVAAAVVIGFLLVADGIMEIVLGAKLRHRNVRGGWLIGGGVLSLFLGALILSRLPWSTAAIGLLLGIRLIFKGIELIAGSPRKNQAQTIESRAA